MSVVEEKCYELKWTHNKTNETSERQLNSKLEATGVSERVWIVWWSRKRRLHESAENKVSHPSSVNLWTLPRTITWTEQQEQQQQKHCSTHGTASIVPMCPPPSLESFSRFCPFPPFPPKLTFPPLFPHSPKRFYFPWPFASWVVSSIWFSPVVLSLKHPAQWTGRRERFQK